MKARPANRILSELPAGDLARLMPLLKPIILTAGQQLAEAGPNGRYIYFPETSIISSICAMEDGKSAEVGMIGCEGVAGVAALLGREGNEYSLQVSIGGRALEVNAQDFARAMALRNGVQQRLLDYSATYVAQVTRRSACGILHRLEQRLAVWLLLLADRLPDSALEITHEQIAERLGVRRAGITVLAANMKTAGVISYSRGSLRIVDRPKLEALACECYRVLALVPPENPVGLETFPPALGVVSSSPAATLVAHKISLRG